MKILYGARFVRMDILRIVGFLACAFTRWTKDCDKRLHRLVSYINTTLSARQVGWVADPLSTLQPVLYADADFAGCVLTQRSTTGVFLCIRGPKTCWPILGLSKRQGCVSNSTPEAELVATSHALRVVGCPAVTLWQALLPHSPKMRFLEDNQAMLQCIRTGRNPTMRHLQRTHRVQVSWVHEQYKSEHFLFNHEGGDRMPPDIFTKMFSDKAKWIEARHLINIVLPHELSKIIEDCKKIYKGILEKPAFAVVVQNTADKGDSVTGGLRKDDVLVHEASSAAPASLGGGGFDRFAFAKSLRPNSKTRSLEAFVSTFTCWCIEPPETWNKLCVAFSKPLEKRGVSYALGVSPGDKDNLVNPDTLRDFRLRGAVRTFNQSIAERTPSRFTWSSILIIPISNDNKEVNEYGQFGSAVMTFFGKFDPFYVHSVIGKRKFRFTINPGCPHLFQGSLLVPPVAGNGGPVILTVAHDDFDHDKISPSKLVEISDVGFRLVPGSSAAGYSGKYPVPCKSWERRDAQKRADIMNMIRGSIAQRAGVDFFWHRTHRWIYGIQLAPRQDLLEPPGGLDIDYEKGVMCIVKPKDDFDINVIPCDQWSRFLAKSGPAGKTWMGFSAYPRVRMLSEAMACTPDVEMLPVRDDPHGECSDGEDAAGDATPVAVPTLVEACCEEDSLLSKRTRWSGGRDVVCVTEDLDFTSKKGIEVAKRSLKGPDDALWLSCPCTGGSQWVSINWHRGRETRDKIRQHWVLFHRIWDAFTIVASHALGCGARVFVEWPRGCSYWHEPSVQRLLA